MWWVKTQDTSLYTSTSSCCALSCYLHHTSFSCFFCVDGVEYCLGQTLCWVYCGGKSLAVFFHRVLGSVTVYLSLSPCWFIVRCAVWFVFFCRSLVVFGVFPSFSFFVLMCLGAMSRLQSRAGIASRSAGSSEGTHRSAFVSVSPGCVRGGCVRESGCRPVWVRC